MKTMATAQTVVVGTGKPDLDVPAVQAAVDKGGNVALEGRFSFDRPPTNARSILVGKAVVISGIVDEQGEMATIVGGLRPFAVNAPGLQVTIQGLRFLMPKLQAIRVNAVTGLRIANCRIEGVKSDLDPTKSFYTAQGIFIAQNVQAGQTVSGSLSIVDNEMEIGSGTSDSTGKLGIDRTLGIVIIEAGSQGWEVFTDIARNKVKTVTGFGVDFRGIAGTATIEGNKIEMASKGPSILVSGVRCLGSGRFLVTHNSINCGFENAAGIRLQGSSAKVAITGATVESNEITMSMPDGEVAGSQSAGIELRRHCRGNAVLHNRILGRALAALSLVPESGMIPSDNTFVGNDHANFISSLAEVFIGQGVTNTVVVGGAGTIDDHGIDTTVKGGYQTLSGDHDHSPGGVGEEVSDAEALWTSDWSGK